MATVERSVRYACTCPKTVYRGGRFTSVGSNVNLPPGDGKLWMPQKPFDRCGKLVGQIAVRPAGRTDEVPPSPVRVIKKLLREFNSAIFSLVICLPKCSPISAGTALAVIRDSERKEEMDNKGGRRRCLVGPGIARAMNEEMSRPVGSLTSEGCRRSGVFSWL